MKKVNKWFRDLFDKEGPTIELFEKRLNEMDLVKREKTKKEAYQLAFSHWNDFSKSHQQFFIKWIAHDREYSLNYIFIFTPLRDIRFKPRYPRLFIKMLHLLEVVGRRRKLSFRHLAFCLLIVFDFRYTLRTLAEYLRRARIFAEEVLILSGKAKIENDILYE